MIIGRNSCYIICSRWIYHLPQRKWIFQKIHLGPNYLPRKIANIHFYNNRQKTNFLQFIAPNLEFIYYLWLLTIKMESYKEEKIISWSGKIRFSNHLPQMNIICRSWIPKKLFLCLCTALSFKARKLAPEVFWANLMHFILLFKIRFDLREVFEVLLFKTWPEMVLSFSEYMF
jgi:hypothetical protein